MEEVDYFQRVIDRIGEVCRKRGWRKDWNGGGCYIHLEVSEFIESLRGKGGSPPANEAADVLFTLCAVLDHYGIRAVDVLSALDNTIDDVEAGTIGVPGGQ